MGSFKEKRAKDIAREGKIRELRIGEETYNEEDS